MTTGWRNAVLCDAGMTNATSAPKGGVVVDRGVAEDEVDEPAPRVEGDSVEAAQAKIASLFKSVEG